MAKDRATGTGSSGRHEEAVATSGWLEGSFADDLVRGELGSIGSFTLIATPADNASTGWVTIVDGRSDALYGTYRLDGVGVVALTIVGGTGRFTAARGSLVGSCDVKRPRWWLSGSLSGVAAHSITTTPPPP